jgi:mannosyl-oligosaccharide alpha-1,2-mannosidase
MPFLPRRFRFLALAVFAAIALFLLTRSTSTYENYRSYAEEEYENVAGGDFVIRPDAEEDQTKEQPQEAAGPLKEEIVPGPVTQESTLKTAPRTTPPATTTNAVVVEFSSETAPGSEKVVSTATLAPTQPLPLDYQPLAPIYNDEEIPIELGQGRFEATRLPPVNNEIHWTKQPEHFPVTDTIQLPTNKASSIPRIQHKFAKSSNRDADTDRLAVIKAAAEHSWRGYRDHAWGHDEIKPVSGMNGDPFNGWGATLVDGLDTLWIMGMEPEFEEAVKFVETIDFTTSPRSDIPLFETTIRYLGGLVAAYEVSGAKYRVLLDKAVELAEVLYSAFDTPNRMPQTYYRWKPTFSSQPHRASTRVVLAEIGSLSMEFTRLAQLSGEPKYYDAIARITNAMDEFQNSTRLPGMWPTYIDASGCAKPAQMNRPVYGTHLYHPDGSGNVMIADAPVRIGEDNRQSRPPIAPGKAAHEIIKEGETQAAATKEQSGIAGEVDGFKNPKEENRWTDTKKQQKRQQDSQTLNAQPSSNDSSSNVPGEFQFHTQDNAAVVLKPQTGADVCIPQGLGSPSKYGSETYTLAGMSDSTYEYLPKMHLLLGGRVDQYKDMYIKSADVAIEKLVYKPMTKDGRDILAAGDLSISPNSSSKSHELIENFKAVDSHLVCFAGGMFALGGAIFDRPEDIEIGKKLTDGCVWAYNVTATGIMPEEFFLSKCESKTNCEWNETKYFEELDPYRAHRAKTPTILGTYNNKLPPILQGTDYDKELNKRQVDPELQPDSHEKASTGAIASSIKDAALPTLTASHTTDPEANIPGPPIPKLSALKPIYTPPPPLSHEEYVAKKIEEERLPSGFTSITSKNYILRPEAIESVFYMYRITGEQYWRDRGWEMFTAVSAHTSTVFGNSAIDDVTKVAPELKVWHPVHIHIFVVFGRANFI